MLGKHHFLKTKNIIRLKEVTKLIFEIFKGSLKINSSIMGNIRVAFKMLNVVNLNSRSKGNKSKDLNGSTIIIPAITSIKIRTRKEFHNNLRKREMELIS